MAVVVPTKLTGFSKATFTAGVQQAYRLTIAAEASTSVDNVILSNIRDVAAGSGRRRLDGSDGDASPLRRRELSAGAVDFDTSIAVADAAAATAMQTTVKAVTPTQLKATLVTQLRVVKDSGNFADVVAVDVAAIASAIVVAPDMAAIATQTVTGGDGSGGDGDDVWFAGLTQRDSIVAASGLFGLMCGLLACWCKYCSGKRGGKRGKQQRGGRSALGQQQKKPSSHNPLALNTETLEILADLEETDSDVEGQTVSPVSRHSRGGGKGGHGRQASKKTGRQASKTALSREDFRKAHAETTSNPKFSI